MKAKILGMLLACSGAMTVLPPSSCHPNPANDGGDGGGITVGGATDAAAGVVGGICYFIEGIDPTGAIANICATIEEVIAAIAYLQSTQARGGTYSPDAGPCVPMPQSQYCATAAERYKAIKYIVQMRAARLIVDGGK